LLHRSNKAYSRILATVSQALQQHRLVLSITQQHSQLQNGPKMRGYKAKGSKGLMTLKHIKKGRKSTKHTKSYSVHGVRYHKHKAGTKRRKNSGYRKRPYASHAKKWGA